MENGGALHLGVWSTQVTVADVRLQGNTAAGSGGAINMMGMSSRLEVLNTTADGNCAGIASCAPKAMQQDKWAFEVSKGAGSGAEGGAVALVGERSTLHVEGGIMRGNKAPQVRAWGHL